MADDDFCIRGMRHWSTMKLGLPKLELEGAVKAGRIMDARSEIPRGLRNTRGHAGLARTRTYAIQHALSGLRGVEREEVRYADEKHREAAKLAVEKLRCISPAKILKPFTSGLINVRVS